MRTSGILLIVLLAAVFCVSFGQNAPAANSLSGNETTPVSLALKGAEPEIPQDLDDPPFYTPPMPSKTVSINEVMAKGQEIPLDFIYNDPDWKRKSFKEYWHSKYQRWNSVPLRIHYAMHRLFTTYPTASVYYDFIHNLGIAEESVKFKGYLPKPPKDTPQKSNPFQKVEAVIMQTDVKKIITYGNQIVLIGKPRRTGLQALVIPVDLLKPFNADEKMLFQLATSEGDEIDYSVISIAKLETTRQMQLTTSSRTWHTCKPKHILCTNTILCSLCKE